MRVAGGLCFLFVCVLYGIHSSEALSASGSHVCSYTCSQQYTYRQRYTTKCGFAGWRRCTRHRTVTGTRQATCYRCCSGWISTDNVNCNTAKCFAYSAGSCPNGGRCTAPNRCSCTTGFGGQRCGDINECSTGNGRCAHTCANSHGSFRCSCRTGYALASNNKACTDINECATSNGGCHQKCSNAIGSFSCSCFSGYQFRSDGRTCNDIDECLNPTTCHHNCSNSAGSFTCSCRHGYTLTSDNRTCQDNNECASVNGGCEQSCINLAGSFRCDCLSGYRLKSDIRTCTDIDECSENTSGCEQSCRNTRGSFTCYCRAGMQLGLDGKSCADINECEVANGGCSQVCQNLNPGFQCGCLNGFELNADNRTCTDVDECAAGGQGCSDFCVNDIGTFHCECPAGYELQGDNKTCTDKNECNTGNGGCSHTCTNAIGSFECSCPVLTHRLDADKRTCQVLSDLSVCTATPTSACVCPSNLHLLPGTSYCADSCFLGPCEHRGVCSVAGPDYLCNCTDTGYTGQDCETGVINFSTKALVVDIHEQSYVVSLTAHPETELVLTSASNGSVLKMIPNPVILRSPETHVEFTVIAEKRGIHDMHFIPSGRDAPSFTEETLRVTVHDVFSKFSPGSFKLPRGCFYQRILTCPQPEQAEMLFSSTSTWYQLDTDSNVKYTFGISFIEIDDLSLPISLTGLEIHTNPSTNSFTLGPVSSVRQVADGTQITDRRDNGCIELPLTSRDIQTFLNSFTVFKDVIISLYNKLPPWLRLTPKPTPYIHTTALWSRVLDGRKVQQIPSCRGGPLYDAALYHVFRFTEGTQLSVMGSEITLPDLSSGSEYCLIIDLCHDYGTTLIVMFPSEASATLQELKMFSGLTADTGIQIIPVGIGLSIPRKLNVARSVTDVELWNGDEKFDYDVMDDANIWVSASMQKSLDSSKSGFDFAVSGDTELFISLPNLKQFFNGILLDEWNILFRHSSTFAIQLRMKVFGKFYTLRIKDFVQASTYAYASLGGDQPRTWCGPNANPPGAFAKFALDAHLFRGIPILEDIIIRGDVVSYGFITFDDLDNVSGLSPKQLYLEILELLKDKVEQTWDFIQMQANNILSSVKQLVKDVLLRLKDKWQELVNLVKSAIDKIKQGKLPSLSILGDLANIVTELKDIFDEVKSNSLMIFETAVDDFAFHMETSLEYIKNYIDDLTERATTEIHSLISGNRSFGIKAQMGITLFGWRLPDIGGEYVYSDTELSRCSKFQFAYTELQGEGAFRIYGEFLLGDRIFKFFRADVGSGLEFALAKESKKWVARIHARLVFFSLRISTDVFVNTRGLYARTQAKIFNLFRASLAISADVAVPKNELALRVEGELLAGGDDSFQGSFLDALRKQAKRIGDAAADRISQAQNALTSAQRKLTQAQDWLERKKSDIDKANVVFDRAIAGLEKAKQKLEDAKGPFLKANAKLNAAQRKVDRLCRIRSCGKICVPGLKCKICKKKVGWVRIPYPCCRWTSCMIKIPNPVCEAANLVCRGVRAIAYAALEAAKLIVKAPLLVLDGAKALLSAAQVVVDKSRVILDVVKLALSAAQLVLEGAKTGIEATKVVLEAVKLAVRAAFWVFNFIVQHGLQNIVDIKKCGFAVEVSVASVFEFEVYCEVNVFSLGWSTIRFKMNFRNILQSLWNAAKSVINTALNAIGIGRRKRDVPFIEYKTLTKMRHLYRSLRNADETGNLNTSADDVLSNLAGTFDNNTIELKNSAEFFQDRCAEFRSLSSYLNTTAYMLNSIASAIVDQLVTLRNVTMPVIPDLSSLIRNMTPEAAGINMTEAFQEYNLTEEQVNEVIGTNIDLQQNDTILEILSFYQELADQHQEQIRMIENFNLLEIWRSNMINVTAQSFTDDVCVGFEDCFMHTVTQIQILYGLVDDDTVAITQLHVSEILRIAIDLISKDSLDADSSLAASERLMQLLSLLDGESAFCGSVPVIVLPPANTTALRATNVTIHCQATGVPTPTYKWFKENDDSVILSTLETLHISAIDSDDDGQYTCRASNHIGFIEATADLRVEYSPIIQSAFQKRFDLLLGESIQLECKADAKPEASFGWLSSSNAVHMPFNATLNLENVTASSAGLYKCESTNIHGVNASTEISVQVYEGNVACPRVTVTIGYGHKSYMNQTLISVISGDLTTRFTDALNHILSSVAGALRKQVNVSESSQLLEIVLTHHCNNTIAIKDDNSVSMEFQKRTDDIYKAIELISANAENSELDNTVLFQIESDGYQLISGSFDFDVDAEKTCQPAFRLSTIRDNLCISDVPDVTVGVPRNLAVSGLLLSWDAPVKGSAFIKEYEVRGKGLLTNDSMIMRVPRAPASLIELHTSKLIEVDVRAISEFSSGQWTSIKASLDVPSFIYCTTESQFPGCIHCVPEQLLADPSDCNKYYQCLSTRIVMHRSCPESLQFNIATNECDYASNVHCQAISGTSDDTLGAPTNLVLSGLTFAWDPPSQGDFVIRSYDVSATDLDNGASVSLTTLHHTSVSLLDMRSATEVQASVRAVTDNEHGPWASITATVEEPSFPYCIHQSRQPGCQECDVGVLLRHPTDCNSYYQCIAGGAVVRLYCPPRLWFDQTIGVCNWESLVQCRDIDSPPA